MMYRICYLNSDNKEMLARDRAWTRKGAMELAAYARDYWNMTALIYRWGRLRVTVQRDHVTIIH